VKRAKRPKRARTAAREADQASLRRSDKLMRRLAQDMPHEYQLQTFGKVVKL
jgi:hypothetical protein